MHDIVLWTVKPLCHQLIDAERLKQMFYSQAIDLPYLNQNKCCLWNSAKMNNVMDWCLNSTTNVHGNISVGFCAFWDYPQVFMTSLIRQTDASPTCMVRCILTLLYRCTFLHVSHRKPLYFSPVYSLSDLPDLQQICTEITDRQHFTWSSPWTYEHILSEHSFPR